MLVSRVILSDRKSIEDILTALDKRLTIEDNMQAAIIDVADTGLADTEFTVTHNLGKIPTFYLVNIDRAGIVYDSNRAGWTSTVITLKCSSANAVLKLVVL